jgi:hypothetical protein
MSALIVAALEYTPAFACGYVVGAVIIPWLGRMLADAKAWRELPALSEGARVGT